jgi:hypothetical protein
MKKISIFSYILFIILVITITYNVMAAINTQAQPYKVISQEKEFEIRFYPAATIAFVNSKAKNYKELSSSGFKTLAGYIFGANQTKKHIAMTTPVQMDINDSLSSMAFVMPSGFTPENMPKPNDSNVKIRTTKDEYVAAIRFSGYASDEKIKLYTDKLKKELDAKAITYNGNFRFLGYNAPYQFFNRRNEIIVSLNLVLK